MLWLKLIPISKKGPQSQNRIGLVLSDRSEIWQTARHWLSAARHI